MKALPAGLQSALDSGATTLCRCWRVALKSGTVLGFTDHDRTLSFAGTDYEPASGFTASEAQSSLGLAVDTDEVAGALSSDRIAADDVALGLWDDAEVTLTLVDWSDPANRVIIHRGSIGEIERGETAFRAELRSLAHRLAEERGRTFQRTCDAVLGDGRCGVDLDTPTFRGDGAVTAVAENRVITASGLASFSSGWFGGGRLLWLTGANAGAAVEVRAHEKKAGVVTIVPWQRPALAVAAGDTFRVTAGCDKTFATCRSKFGNGVNFRGFPHMPGNDVALSVAQRQGRNDGGSLFK